MGWLIGWWLMACRSETPALDLNARLRWLLLLAGASFLVGCAVWLATPSVSFVIPIKSTPAGQGRTELSQSVLPALLGILFAALLPLLRPQRLLERWQHPKKFWEPWVFRVACMAALIGVPLLGVWFFARHNISGYNSIRERTLLASDLEWDRFWRRAKKEYDPAKARTELTPAASTWHALSPNQTDTL